MKNSRVVGVIVLLSLVVLVALGSWQVQRLAWKTELIERLQTRIAQTAVPLREVLERSGKNTDLEYLPVTVRGSFDHRTEKHLYALDGKGRPGWHIYTLMQIKRGDCADCAKHHQFAYINRGFVPYGLKNRDSRPQGQVSAPVELVGLIRIARAGKSYFEAANQPAKNQWFWPSLSEMKAADGKQNSALSEHLVPFFIDERAAVKVAGKYFGKYDGKFYRWPRAGVTRVNIANRHLGYIITWYGLALALLGVYGFFLYGNKNESIGEAE